MEDKYTMEDIANFLIDYRKCQMVQPIGIMTSIPVVGTKLYQKASLEDQKRNFFETRYKEVLNGTEEEQKEFISKMAPVLDEFYSSKGKGRAK